MTLIHETQDFYSISNEQDMMKYQLSEHDKECIKCIEMYDSDQLLNEEIANTIKDLWENSQAIQHTVSHGASICCFCLFMVVCLLS